MKYRNLDSQTAFTTLKALAKSPYNLRAPGALNRERVSSYRAKSAGYTLLYATQRVDDACLDALQALADESEVIAQFKAMKQGETLNRIDGYDSENRMVLHTAARDLFDPHPQHPEAARQAKEELDKLKQFCAALDAPESAAKFTDMVTIGIGGSDLGPRALYLALEAFKKPERRVHFISNVDPDDAAAVLKGLDLKKTLVNVVSKSGGTLETLTNETLVRAAFKRAGLDPKEHFTAVTGKGSPMDNPERYLRSFYMFDYIGGRYSATSMVGAVMLAFALGYEQMEEILRGANRVDKEAEKREIRDNIPLLLALLGVWNHNFLGHNTLAILPYSQALIRFTAHLQQCDMESNGKSINRQGEPLPYQSGPIIWGEPGTNGQHAFYQLLHQGTTIVPAEFIGFRESQYGQDMAVEGSTSQEKLCANLLAQSLALASGKEAENPNRVFPGNRPNSILMGQRLTPESMGELLAIYEAKIVFQGFIWNINSFDQEGVQLGKQLAQRFLKRMGDGDDRKEDTPCALLQAAELS